MLERLRQNILPPFDNFSRQLARSKNRPGGTQLAGALRELWNDLKVEQTLERWTPGEEKSAIHQTVWVQMNSWLENLELAFSNEQMSLRDWLPILEAGLANLTVGVIPPALDQVLVGAIDRARNPDLKLAFVLGVNETIFPAAPVAPAILTDADRDELAVPLGPDLRERLARERYYGYIACTRAGEKLVVTFARRDAEGRALNPSPFITHLKQIIPKLEAEEFKNGVELADTQHANELVVPLMEIQNPVATGATRLNSKECQSLLAPAAAHEKWRELLELPALKPLTESLGALREPDAAENLSPALAEKLFGPTLRSSVSRLEEFAACPFRYFVRSGLRADERKVFELDARERGSFQHDVLKIFHEQLAADGKRWRDLAPAAARERIAGIAAGLAQSPAYRNGLLRDSAQTQFEARALTSALQDFVESTGAANIKAAASALKSWGTPVKHAARRIATREDSMRARCRIWTASARRISLIIAGTTIAHCAKVQRKPCRARNLKNCSTALKRNCAGWAKEFFPVRRRWIPIARASRRRANSAIIRRRAGLTSGRTSIACCAQLQRRTSEPPLAAR